MAHESMGRSAENDAPMTKGPNESQTAFTIRSVQAEAWDRCFGYYFGGTDPENPYRVTPPAAPTMAQADCRCPDDCDCDGRFACEEQAGETLRFCELVVGHEGWHQAGNHYWQPRPIPSERGADA